MKSVKPDLDTAKIPHSLWRDLVRCVNRKTNDSFGTPDQIVLLPFGIDPPTDLRGYSGTIITPEKPR